TPHDLTSIPESSLWSPLLDRPRHNASSHPALPSNRANTCNTPRSRPLTQHSLHRLPACSIAPPAISRRPPCAQIPIPRAVPPTCPFPRSPPSEVFGRRPQRAWLSRQGAGIRKPSHLRTSRHAILRLADEQGGRLDHESETGPQSGAKVLRSVQDGVCTPRI